MSLDISLRCKCCGTNILDQNITHNLTEMAGAVQLYNEIWRPEKGIKAKELIKPLKRGIRKLKSDPAQYRKYEPENKWGTYNDFVPWLIVLFKACVRNPDSLYEVSR